MGGNGDGSVWASNKLNILFDIIYVITQILLMYLLFILMTNFITVKNNKYLKWSITITTILLLLLLLLLKYLFTYS